MTNGNDNGNGRQTNDKGSNEQMPSKSQPSSSPSIPRLFQTLFSVSAGMLIGVGIASTIMAGPFSMPSENGTGINDSASSSSAVEQQKKFIPAQQAQAYTQAPPSIKEDYLPSEKTVIDLFERATQSVAYVTTYTESRGGFSLNPMETPAGTGSGIVWDSDGRIVTNFHVIRAASGAKITLANKKTYDAELVGTSADDDVAVLKINAPRSELVPIEVGSSSTLRVGQSTYAIGNPFGLDHTLTTGVLSGLGREMKSPTGRTISNVIQTEASINPGNSGGPLVDAKGRLIGMNTAIYSPSGASAGVGFAIPVDTLRVIADALIKNGKVIRPVIGISYLESAQARALGVEKGVLVLDVPDGSEAFKSGLRPTSRQTFGSIELGDVIIAVDDDEIGNEGDLFKALDKHKVGDTVKLRVLNTDGERTLKLKLSASQN